MPFGTKVANILMIFETTLQSEIQAPNASNSEAI